MKTVGDNFPDQDILDPEDVERQTVRALNAEARQELTTHPSGDEILADHERSLSAWASERLRDHLAICPDCAQQALDLAAFSQPELFLEDDDPPASEAASEWAEIQQKLSQEGLLGIAEDAAPSEEPEGSTVLPFTRAKPVLLDSVRFAQAIAALFFLTSLASILWLFMLVRSTTEPQAGPHLVDLPPIAVVQRDAAIVPASPINAFVDTVLILSVSSIDPARLELGADGRPDRTGYRAEIFDPQRPERKVVRTIDRLEIIDSSCTIRIPGGSLKPGAYAIRLYQPNGDRLAEYQLDVESP